MRARAIIGVICPALLLCGAALAAEQPSATAQPPAPPPAAGLLTPVTVAEPPVALFVPPQNAFDLLYRYFPVTGELAAKVAPLRQEWNTDTSADGARVEQEVDAKFAPGITAGLDEKQKADFARISAAIKTFWAGAEKADKEYAEALAAVGVRVQSQWLPDDPVRLLAILPRTAGQSTAYLQLMGEYENTLARERLNIRTAAQTVKSDDKSTPAERNEALQKAEAEALDKVRAEFVQKAQAALKGMPQEKAYNDLVVTLATWNAKKREIRAALVKELPGAAARQPGSSSPGSQADYLLAPRRSVEIIVRFLSPTPEQEVKLNALRTDWEKEQQKLRAERATQLDAKYADRIAALLDEPSRENYKRACSAVAAYRRDVSQAEAAYRDVWTAAGLGPFRVRTDGMWLASAMPGLTREQRQTVTGLRTDCLAQLSRERAAFYNGKPSLSADGREGPRSRAELEALTQRTDAEYTAKVRAALGDTPQGKAYQAVNDARQAYAAQERALLVKLFGELKPTVGEERLMPKAPMPPRSARTITPPPATPAAPGATATPSAAPQAK